MFKHVWISRQTPCWAGHYIRLELGSAASNCGQWLLPNKIHDVSRCFLQDVVLQVLAGVIVAACIMALGPWC
jgi:hypothetical protein